MDAVTIKALKVLKANRGHLTRQQIRTLKGQVLVGDPAGAMRGLQKLINKKKEDPE